MITTQGLGLRLVRERLQELEAIAVVVGGVEAPVSREMRIPLHRAFGCLQPLCQRVQVVNENTGMRLSMGHELGLDAQGYLPAAGAEPASPTGGPARPLVDFDHLQHATVDEPGHILYPRRDSQLNMVDSLEREGHHPTGMLNDR